MAKLPDRVRFNVGGKIFETTATTLAKAGRDSMLGILIDENWNLAPGDSAASEFFIDRNPECFSVLLDLLRSGELHLPPHISDKLLYREALFYGLLDHVRAARWGPFEGDRLRLSASVYGHTTGRATAVRAAPNGGCCVAHGSIVHVYDWMLQERRPINLDYKWVCNAGYVDPSHIVVTGGGGMGLFSSLSGELRHRFQVCHDNKVKSFTAGALSFSDSQLKIFAICNGGCNESGIGVWDQNTGDQSDFFYEPPGCSLGDAHKLQRIKGDSFLMVAKLFPRPNKSFIGMLDFREKNLVWSRSTEEGRLTDKEKVLDAIVMEDNRTICVVNLCQDLGFLDLRINRGEVRWSRSRRINKSSFTGLERCYPKLVMNGGKLFSSMEDSISVFCGPEWVQTSTLRRSDGGSICNFSIGGDRLFALHIEENVFDVWESPTLPNL